MVTSNQEPAQTTSAMHIVQYAMEASLGCVFLENAAEVGQFKVSTMVSCKM